MTLDGLVIPTGFIFWHCFRGAFKYDEVLSLADDAAISSVKKNQHLIKTDEGCNIQFTSVSDTRENGDKRFYERLVRRERRDIQKPHF